jgi:predicted dienelactone hydrolase
MEKSRTVRRLSAVVLSAALALGLGVITGPDTAVAATNPPRLTLPPPTGPDQIGTVDLYLVDPTRTDPFVPSHPVRELMVQLWYPARDTAHHPAAPWLDPGAVPHFEQSLGLPSGVFTLPVTDGHINAPVAKADHARPVVLYSPGLGADRAVGTTLVEDLVSHGYIVVAIDHTHDASEVEFPGGRIEVSTLPPVTTTQIATEAEQVRVADTQFVLNELTVLDRGGNPDAEHRALPAGIPGTLDLSHLGMFGWSIGGATAAGAMFADSRIAAGIDMDGTLYGPVVTAGLDRPFMLMSSQDHNRDNDPTWAAFWAVQRGAKLDLKLTNSQHTSYSDGEALYPEIAPLIGLPPSQQAQLIGTIDPARAVAAERAYVRAFFNRTLRHRDGDLLDGPSPRFPEIQFVR